MLFLSHSSSESEDIMILLAVSLTLLLIPAQSWPLLLECVLGPPLLSSELSDNDMDGAVLATSTGTSISESISVWCFDSIVSG
uniref:Putative secreted protein n=1 Tax=Panstrongylus lignarius TaxID=156445 RepID=A0A224XZJ1_9HEMI